VEQTTVKKLLESDQDQYVYLAQASEMMNKLKAEYPSPTSKAVILQQYKDKVLELFQKWGSRQENLLTKKPDGGNYFNLDFISDSDKQPVIDWFARGLRSYRLSGVGWIAFIPIAIKAVTWIIVAFSAEKIISHLSNSESEKTDLINSTAKVIEDLGLSKEEAKSFFTAVLKKDGSDGILGLFSLKNLAIAGIIYLVVTNWKTIKKKIA